MEPLRWNPPSPGRFWPNDWPWPHGWLDLGKGDGALERHLRGFPPGRPGFYAFLNADGRPLYIGKALSLRHRLMSHLRGGIHLGKKSRETGAEPAKSLFFGACLDELGALVWERELIGTWRPHRNRVHNPPPRRWLWLVPSSRLPGQFAMVAKRPSSGSLAWGPFRGGTMTTRLKVALNQPIPGLSKDCAWAEKLDFLEGRNRRLLRHHPEPTISPDEVNDPRDALCWYERWRVRKEQAQTWSGFLAIAAHGCEAWGIPTLTRAPFHYVLDQGCIVGVMRDRPFGNFGHEQGMGPCQTALVSPANRELEAGLVNSCLMAPSERAQNFVFAQTTLFSKTSVSA